ncbi:Hypothetical predicted protein, partial [Pelobates cultripes]
MSHLTGLVSHLDAAEATSTRQAQDIAELKQEIQALKQKQAKTDQRFTAMEDARSRNNLKICRIPEDIPAEEIPHLL